MPTVVTINRPDVVDLIEKAARQLTNGNKTEAVAMAMRRLLDLESRTGTLFGRQRGSVRIAEGVDLIEPVFDDEMDAETGRELEH